MARESASNTEKDNLVEFAYRLKNQPGDDTLYLYIPGNFDGVGELAGWLWEAIEDGMEAYIASGENIRRAYIRVKPS